MKIFKRLHMCVSTVLDSYAEAERMRRSYLD